MAHVNGVELHYTDSGTDGVAVMLLHGGMGDLGSWPHQSRALLAAIPGGCVQPPAQSPEPKQRTPRRVGRIASTTTSTTSWRCRPRWAPARRTWSPLHTAQCSRSKLHLRAPAKVASLVLAEPPLHRWLRATEAGEQLYNAFIAGRLACCRRRVRAGLQRRAMHSDAGHVGQADAGVVVGRSRRCRDAQRHGDAQLIARTIRSRISSDPLSLGWRCPTCWCMANRRARCTFR